MKQVETNSYDVQRLLHVKGKRNVVAGEVDRPAGHRAGNEEDCWAGRRVKRPC